MKRFIMLAGLVASVGVGNAQAFTMTDGNAVVDGDSAVGLYNWFTDGVDDLFNQDYYYRIGMNPEAQISTIGNAVVNQLAPNIVNVAYTDAVLRVDITYTLIGGAPGSGTSEIGEIIRVQNLTNSAMSFHLFEYDDFDLAGTAGGDSAMLLNGSTIMQWENLTTAMVGTVPPFDRWEIASFPTILAKLTDGVPDDLANGTSPLGPGDMTFAMQWDRVIGPNGTFLMSKNKRIEVVPEPASLAALGLGFAALLRRRRK